MAQINSIEELEIGEYPVELVNEDNDKYKYKTNLNNFLVMNPKIVYVAKANNHIYIITYCTLYGFIHVYKNNHFFTEARAFEQSWCSEFPNDDVVLFTPMSNCWDELLQNDMIINPDEFEEYISFNVLLEKFYSVIGPVSIVAPTLLKNQS